MKRFKITITETYTKDVEICAVNEQQAEDLLRKGREQGEDKFDAIINYDDIAVDYDIIEIEK